MTDDKVIDSKVNWREFSEKNVDLNETIPVFIFDDCENPFCENFVKANTILKVI